MDKKGKEQLELSGDEDRFNRFLFDNEGIELDESPQKQNMNLGTFSTSQDLDSQLDDILKSIEPVVLSSLRKTKYFDKTYKVSDFMKLNYKCEFNGIDNKCDNSINSDSVETLYNLNDKLDKLFSGKPTVQQLQKLQLEYENLISSKKLSDQYSKKAGKFLDAINEKISETKGKNLPLSRKEIQKPTSSKQEIQKLPPTNSKQILSKSFVPDMISPNSVTSDQAIFRAKNIDKFDKINTKLEKSLIENNKSLPITDIDSIKALKSYAINADMLDTMESMGKGDELKIIGNDEDYDMNTNYSIMNQYARDVQNGNRSWEKAPKQMKINRDIIYSALEKSKIPQDITVYRGVDAIGNRQYVSAIIKTGNETTDPTFRSTSINPAIAETYAFPDHDNQVIEVIDVPKGSKGRFLDVSITTTPEEKEVLLQANTKYKTLDVKKSNGITYVHRKVII
jgi:hypothetical protein